MVEIKSLKEKYTVAEAAEILRSYKVKELREISKENNLKGYVYMRKGEIICALLSNVYGKEVLSIKI